jgi:hypothetical protein
MEQLATRLGLFYGWVVLAAVMLLDVCTSPAHSTGTPTGSRSIVFFGHTSVHPCALGFRLCVHTLLHEMTACLLHDYSPKHR